MRLKIISAMAAALLLAACASDEAATTGNANAGGGTTTDNGITQGAVTPGSAEDFQQNVGDRVFFDTDRYDLSAEAQSQLQKQAAWLKQYPAVTVTIEGHCDERGTREYNLALGERRANAVANYMTALGVDAGRLSVISYGKERPQCTDSNESCWAQNRRGVTTVNK
ncbi:MAG TPA: peptidoglycan-associated lipoprotein Pal [Dongiaceae bacterium]|jgi:peptidoglycan-associated lipoprotein|nr:peptidoglycan-associated lipoprotein Pal [Dongiaceae bacterium]